MEKIEKTFRWCLKLGENGEKHKGIKKVNILDLNELQAHLKKAESNLETMQYLYDGAKTDGWLQQHFMLCIMLF